MKDQITLDRIKLVHPKLRAEVAVIYDEIVNALRGKAFCRFTHTLRTFKEQEAIYAQGRTKPGPIVSKAKPGLSLHNYGLAIDIVLIDAKSVSWDMKKDFDGDGKADWMEVVAVFKKYGWEWGGDWKRFPDAPHFQKAFGKTPSQYFALWNAKKVDSQGYVII